MNDMKVTMILSDFAQVVNGKLYIMGGGWSIIGPEPCPTAIAIKIEVPWSQTNQKHNLKVELLDSAYHPVLVSTQVGNSPLKISADYEVGRPAGLIQGTSLDVPIAFNIAPMPLEPGKRYIWKLTIDGHTNDEWQVAFSTRQHKQKTAA